jgi:hypothetical protein
MGSWLLPLSLLCFLAMKCSEFVPPPLLAMRCCLTTEPKQCQSITD